MLLLLLLLLLPLLVCSRWLDERAALDAVDGGSQRLSRVAMFHQYKR